MPKYGINHVAVIKVSECLYSVDRSRAATLTTHTVRESEMGSILNTSFKYLVILYLSVTDWPVHPQNKFNQMRGR